MQQKHPNIFISTRSLLKRFIGSSLDVPAPNITSCPAHHAGKGIFLVPIANPYSDCLITSTVSTLYYLFFSFHRPLSVLEPVDFRLHAHCDGTPLRDSYKHVQTQAQLRLHNLSISTLHNLSPSAQLTATCVILVIEVYRLQFSTGARCNNFTLSRAFSGSSSLFLW
jgi:hypothetical protein